MPRTDYPEHLIRQVSPKCCTLQLNWHRCWRFLQRFFQPRVEVGSSVGCVTCTGLQTPWAGPWGIIPFTLADDPHGLWGQSSATLANGIIPIIQSRWDRAGHRRVCLWEEIWASSSMWGVRGPRGAQECPSFESHVPVLPPSEMLMCSSTLYMWSEEYKPPGTSCWHFYKGGRGTSGAVGLCAGGFLIP